MTVRVATARPPVAARPCSLLIDLLLCRERILGDGTHPIRHGQRTVRSAARAIAIMTAIGVLRENDCRGIHEACSKVAEVVRGE